jgi:aryl-alcohol dehydrogenase-like predicted oxidoreductase
LAIGFVQAHARDVSTLLVGTTSPEHLRRNIDALDASPLPSDVLHALCDLTSSPADNT